jgi:hypothetical protein
MMHAHYQTESMMAAVTDEVGRGASYTCGATFAGLDTCAAQPDKKASKHNALPLLSNHPMIASDSASGFAYSVVGRFTFSKGLASSFRIRNNRAIALCAAKSFEDGR